MQQYLNKQDILNIDFNISIVFEAILYASNKALRENYSRNKSYGIS